MITAKTMTCAAERGLAHPPPLTSLQRLIKDKRDAIATTQSFRRPAALFLDAAGTFLLPSENVSDVYLRYSRRYGVDADPALVLRRFRAAYNAPCAGPIRYVGGAEDFWRRIVFACVASTDERIFHDVYQCAPDSLRRSLPGSQVQTPTLVMRYG